MRSLLVVIAALWCWCPVAAAEDYVVGFKTPTGAADQRALLARHGLTLERRLRHLDASVASGTSPALPALRAEPGVAFVEADGGVKLIRPIIGPLAHIAVAPNDRGFKLQHALAQANDHDIDATQAWNRRTTCAKVAVLDTGVDVNHPDLRPNLWRNPNEIAGNGIDDDHNGVVDDVYGADLVRDHGSGIDHNGHGTHVAGIIGARGNNKRGVAGLCWKTEIVSVRVLGDDGGGIISDVASGIVYATEVGAHVINASFTSPTPTEVVRRALDYAHDKGVLVVAAAGNDHLNIDRTPRYPAAEPQSNVISVAASTESDRLARFSNYGPTNVDLAAPGEGIVSTWPGGKYRTVSGTSMAAPFVSAAAAMLREQHFPSAARIRSALLSGADREKSLRGRVASGGRLNVARALSR